MIKSILQIFLLFYWYFSSLNLKYLKLTKMELTRFAMKLFIEEEANDETPSLKYHRLLQLSSQCIELWKNARSRRAISVHP